MDQLLTDDTAQEIHGVKFLSRHMGDLPARDLKPLADRLRQTLGSGVVAVTATENGTASLVVAITDDLADQIDAMSLAQAGIEALGNKHGDQTNGGTRALAQGDGPNVDNAADALTAVGEALAAMLDATMRGEAEAIA